MRRERRVGFYVSLHSELWVGMTFGVQSRPLARPWELTRSVSESCCCLQSGLLLWVQLWATPLSFGAWREGSFAVASSGVLISPFLSEALHIPCEETFFELSQRCHPSLVGTRRHSANTEHVCRLLFLVPLKKNWRADHRGCSEIAPRRLLGHPSRCRLPLGSRLLSQWC